MKKKRSRRDLLTMWTELFRDVGDSLREAHMPDPNRMLRPPGALFPDAAFLQACTGCGECVPACPMGSILMVEIDAGSRLPAIAPSSRPCYLCPDLLCIASCPTGALTVLTGPSAVRMGVAKVDIKRCVTFRGEACTLCFKACPFPGEAIVLAGGRPVVSSSHCTGCGLCEYACPEMPKAILVVPERDLVPKIRIPKDEYLAG